MVGRKKQDDDPDERGRRIQELRDQGMTIGQAAKELGIPKGKAEKLGQRLRRRQREQGDN